jgi:hypothetical protein
MKYSAAINTLISSLFSLEIINLDNFITLVTICGQPYISCHWMEEWCLLKQKFCTLTMVPKAITQFDGDS